MCVCSLVIIMYNVKSTDHLNGKNINPTFIIVKLGIAFVWKVGMHIYVCVSAPKLVMWYGPLYMIG